jgi:hypothetical protein
MGVRILNAGSQAALYCSTSEVAFGPIFHDDDDHDADERAEAFLRWLAPRDPREFIGDELEQKYAEWRAQEAAQWKREADAADES